MAARGSERRGRAAPRSSRTGLTDRPTVAQRIGLVEEHNHPAVAQRELAQLTEQRLHLEDPDTKKHVDEGTWVDEDVRLSRLARDSFGHQRLAGPRRTPEQQPARYVSTLFLDLVRVLEEEDVFFNAREHVVLSPHVREPRLDVVRVIDVDTATRQQPEQADELEGDEEEGEGELEDERHDLPYDRGRLKDRHNRRGIEDLARHNRVEPNPHQDLQDAGETESRPVGEPAPNGAICTAENLLCPEPVISGPVLADHKMNLPDDLKAHQRQQPPIAAELNPDGVRERQDRIACHGRPDHEPPHDSQQEQELDAVPQREPFYGPSLGLGHVLAR